MGLTILCVSQSSTAQVTRNLILEQAGYRVLATEDPHEAVRLFAGSLVDAVVFGETMRAQERIELGTSFKRLKPSVPIVFLYKMSGQRVPPGIADEQVEYLAGPRPLLKAIERVLCKDGTGRDGAAQDDE